MSKTVSHLVTGSTQKHLVVTSIHGGPKPTRNCVDNTYIEVEVDVKHKISKYSFKNLTYTPINTAGLILLHFFLFNIVKRPIRADFQLSLTLL